jgi:hypothetical protein
MVMSLKYVKERSPMKLRRLVVSALCLFATSCETAVTVKGTVTVSPALAGMYAPENPGLVVVQMRLAGSHANGIWSVGVLCGSAEVAAFPFDLTGFGCAAEGTVTAWIESPPARARRDCGVHQEAYVTAPPTSPPSPNVEVTVFKGKSCDGRGTLTGVQLMLE